MFGDKWGDAGSGTFDTHDEELVGLVRGLGGRVAWRVGGSPADYVLYQWANGSWPAGCPSANPAQQPVGGPIPGTPICISLERWAQLCDFARRVRFADWYLGLNALWHRPTPSSPQDFSQIKSLLSVLGALKCPVTGFELGNELGSGTPGSSKPGPRVVAATLARDIDGLRAIVPSSYLLAGPDWVSSTWHT